MNRDIFFYVMVFSMVPMFFIGSLAFWMMTKFTFIPKTVPERTFYILAYVVAIILSVTGSVLYMSHSKHPHIFFPIFIFCGFIVGRIVVNYLIRRLFNEDMD